MTKQNSDKALQQSDLTLYQAKHAGRNELVVYQIWSAQNYDRKNKFQIKVDFYPYYSAI